MVSEQLEPRLDLLREEYVLVQAWKKTAPYIRYYNWYSDTLAIDHVAVNLQTFIGKLRERLQSAEKWKNDPLRLGKLFLFEGGTRVPFAMQYPRLVGGGRIYRHPVSSLDILPTFAALGGGPLPADPEMDGSNLMPFLLGEESPPHEALFWRNGENKAVRQGNWKLFWNQRHIWLFDLSEDIGEVTNMAGEHPEKVEELQGLHRDWETGTEDPAWPARQAPGPVEVDGILVDINI